MNPSVSDNPTPVAGARLWTGLFVWSLVCFAASGLGAFSRPDGWYAALQKPAWNPPNWIFAPVWTTLYALMAVAAWLVWRRGGWAVQRGPLALFVGQLLLNAAWSPLFFGRHRPGLALLDLAVLWVVLGLTVVVFGRVRRVSAGLLAPYLAWVTFAGALNFALWQLNR